MGRRWGIKRVIMTASYPQVAIPLQRIALLLLLGACVPMFTNYDPHWIAYPYDESRALQIVAMSFMCLATVVALCWRDAAHPQQYALTLQPRIGLIVLGTLLVPGFLFSLSRSPLPEHALSDAGLLLMVAASGIGAFLAMRRTPTFAALMTALATLIPVSSIAMLLYAVWLFINGRPNTGWQPNFPNMRIYDSATLVCLFLLWSRPAWLARTTMTIPVIVLAALYITSLLVDGARSVLLSLTGGLIFLAVGYRYRVQQWRVPAASILLGLTLFAGLWHLVDGQLSVLGTFRELARTDGSGRLELWEKAWWIGTQVPLTGVGGGIFGVISPATTVMHPHNLPLQMLAEWGVTGICILIILGILIWQMLAARRHIASMLAAGVVATVIDSLFSANHIYPVTQILCLWIWASALSQMPEIDVKQVSSSWILATKSVILIVALAGTLAIWLQHSADLRCWGCKSKDDIGALRFWHFGRAIHLTP